MRSQRLLRPTRSLLARRTTSQSSLIRHPQTNSTYGRAHFSSTAPALRTHKRTSSSLPPAPTNVVEPQLTTESVASESNIEVEHEAASPNTTLAGTPEDPNEGERPPEEKVRRRRTRTVEADKESSPSSEALPSNLDVLWTPEALSDESIFPVAQAALPPPDIFADVLNNLLVTLHPQTQHRAAYATSAGPPVEPTLSLYCPIEGGDYVIDETVRELARRTGADVVVIDAVQLAAGECGSFGKAASALQLPSNPLHVPSAPPRSPSPHTAPEEEYDDDAECMNHMMMPAQMTLHVMSPTMVRSGRPAMVSSSASRNPSHAKTKAFFDELVNFPPPASTSESSAEAPSTLLSPRRPRLIYVRDYPTLAASAPLWYPQLQQAARQRRQGPIARPSQPVSSPVTIIFGSTPSIIPPTQPTSPAGPQAMLGLMMSRQGASTIPVVPSRPKGQDWGEDEAADKSREKRLRDRLRQWERNENALHDDVPRLPTLESSRASDGQPGMVVMQPSGPEAILSRLGAALGGQPVSMGGREDSSSSSPFFRSCTVVPSTRSPADERSCRIARRREINELTMRMAVGTIGGLLSSLPDFQTIYLNQPGEIQSSPDGVSVQPPEGDWANMWNQWGKQVEAWPNVKDIADRAVGSVVASGAVDLKAPSKIPVEQTPIPWSAVVAAWAARTSFRDARKSWIQQASGKAVTELMEEEDGRSADEKKRQEQDAITQQVKEDPELSPHEQRLLGCIVDSASMPTSFTQVHLPKHTIDSVRTIVSLPLLHPAAFQQGILKQHSMTGCLLFGPPGTGKTLVVRALAKEAGCRMLAVSPSDVMDMYVGEGEKLVRSVFSLARRLSPCVIFLDEIDALFGARMSARESGGAIAHRGVITEFMQEMDGLKTDRDSNVIVIGATNRPFDLDDAVLRRLPRRLLVDLPGEKERAEILKILLRDEVLADEVNISSLAHRTDLFSGSDLKHVCVSAALDAVKENVSVPWEVVRTEDLASPPTASEQPAVASAPSPSAIAPDASKTPTCDAPSEIAVPSRVLHLRNFNKALNEVTPSSSESLGSLAALRQWNEEFGEGRVQKRKVMWGKGRFGFIERATEIVPDGRVSSSSTTAEK